jgi:hypothetical protein
MAPECKTERCITASARGCSCCTCAAAIQLLLDGVPLFPYDRTSNWMAAASGGANVAGCR